jgi:hypothetical protein
MFHLLQCFIDSAIHSLLDSWTRWHSNFSVIHWFIGFVINWFAGSLIHRFIDSSVSWLKSEVLWFADSLIHCFVVSLDSLTGFLFIHWFIDSLTDRFIDSSTHQFIHPLIHCSLASLLRGFIDSCFFASIIHWFTDSATPESTRSLMHWVIASLLHGFIVSLFDWFFASLFRCFTDLSLWFFDLLVSSLVNSVHCAWTFPYRFVSIRTFAHSVIHHLVTTSLRLHLKRPSYRALIF